MNSCMKNPYAITNLFVTSTYSHTNLVYKGMFTGIARRESNAG